MAVLRGFCLLQVSAYGWKDYGNRVGAWRILDMFKEFHLSCAINVNSLVYAHCPELVAYSDSLKHEVVAHSRTNSERQVRSFLLTDSLQASATCHCSLLT